MGHGYCIGAGCNAKDPYFEELLVAPRDDHRYLCDDCMKKIMEGNRACIVDGRGHSVACECGTHLPITANEDEAEGEIWEYATRVVWLRSDTQGQLIQWGTECCRYLFWILPFRTKHPSTSEEDTQWALMRGEDVSPFLKVYELPYGI